MYYLSAFNRGLFKSYYCYVLFLSFEKSFRRYEKSSVHILEKNFFLTNMRNKRVISKINLYCYNIMKNGQIIPVKVCPFQYIHRFFFSREMGNIRACKELRLQKPIKFSLPG